jgi:choloylglycine hydrolase
MAYNTLKAIILGAAIGGFISTTDSYACSRILYVGDTVTINGNDTTAIAPEKILRIVGRSLDWKTPIPTNLYVYPRGFAKQSSDQPNAIKWRSKYGAVYAVGYDGGITEGMNEKGLVINGLFCKGTVYDNAETAKLPPMSLAMFVGWLLDLNATTPEVIDVLQQHNFNIGGATFDQGTVSALHWGVTDAQGRSCVFEFDHGKINIYPGQDMPAMTNDPNFPAMNAINDYWLKVGGANMLPGTVKSPDRFVRGYFFQGHVAHTDDPDLGFSIIRSILMNVSVPYLYTLSDEPNVSSTQWRSFANIRDRRYYFDIVTNPGVFYIDLNKCDLRPGAPVLKLDTSHSADLLGDITSKLKPSAPFTPMY